MLAEPSLQHTCVDQTCGYVWPYVASSYHIEWHEVVTCHIVWAKSGFIGSPQYLPDGRKGVVEASGKHSL